MIVSLLMATLAAQALPAGFAEPSRNAAQDAVFGMLAAEAATTQAGPVTAPAVTAAYPAFAGHYYLSGVMETGSELLLHADATFEWFLSYGAVDQTAHGTWARSGQTIVLTSALPATNKPLFAFIEVEPWSASAEHELVSRERDALDRDVRASCPFLTGDWVASPSSATVDPDKMGADREAPDVLHQKAAAALVGARSARARVEALAREVMARPAAERVARQDEVTEVLRGWLQAGDDARQASLKAGLGAPKLDDPVLPAACTLPDPAEASSADNLRGGLGVRVVDLEAGQGASRIGAVLLFTDGHALQLTTAGRGLALARGPFATGVVKVTLHGDFAEGRDASFDVPATRSGILHFAIDAGQLMVPAFASLRLRIDGKALVPEGSGRGRYERQP